MKTTRTERKTISVEVPVLKCNFCEKCVDNTDPSFGVQRLWGTVEAVTKCGCNNTYHICPECIRIRLREIHDFHHGILAEGNL